MTTPFNLPPLGENVESGTVVRVLVSVGDALTEEQGILEIETDKATLEVPSTVNGVVIEILVKEGDLAEVGDPVLMFDSEGAKGEAEVPAGEPVAKTEPKESAAAPIEVSESPPTPSSETTVLKTAGTNSGGTVPAAPSVRRFAREIGIDISQIIGTGPSGRISIDDVKAHVKQFNTDRSGMPAAGGGVLPEVTLPDFSKWGPVERKPMTNLRRAAAEHLSKAWVNIPHVTYADKADITDLERLRKQHGHRAEEAGGKLTMTAIALKFGVAALKRFPQFNATIDMPRQEIIYKQYYHVGVAVDTDRGLVVPVIRDVDKKKLIELTVELSEIAVKARDRKLSLEDMQGSTFTITNLGGFGGEYFTPIINAPDVAILGIGRGQIEPVYIDGAFEPRMRLPMMLSYDHRLIDGADGARFMQRLIEMFEQPVLLSLEG
ncbi:MAG: 2-oxo acid dehydrogenase subunit E2 [Gemmatimonadota bacterium]|nr:2-oxo acid dehydrogenase subunit E2 [Gemmatimonadota bacterium]